MSSKPLSRPVIPTSSHLRHFGLPSITRPKLLRSYRPGKLHIRLARRQLLLPSPRRSSSHSYFLLEFFIMIPMDSRGLVLLLVSGHSMAELFSLKCKCTVKG